MLWLNQKGKIKEYYIKMKRREGQRKVRCSKIEDVYFSSGKDSNVSKSYRAYLYRSAKRKEEKKKIEEKKREGEREIGVRNEKEKREGESEREKERVRGWPAAEVDNFESSFNLSHPLKRPSPPPFPAAHFYSSCRSPLCLCISASCRGLTTIFIKAPSRRIKKREPKAKGNCNIVL